MSPGCAWSRSSSVGCLVWLVSVVVEVVRLAGAAVREQCRLLPVVFDGVAEDNRWLVSVVVEVAGARKQLPVSTVVVAGCLWCLNSFACAMMMWGSGYMLTVVVAAL